MSARKPRWAALSSTWVLLASGACFHTTAPRGWLPTATEAQRDSYGGWITTDYKAPSTTLTVQGELIAAAPDTVYVLGADSIVAVPTGSLISGTLTTYEARLGTLRLWTLLGTLSAASHGGFLIFSVPLWIIGGTAATAAASKAPRLESTNPDVLRVYARFPQGIPPGLDLRSLKQKDIRTLARP